MNASTLLLYLATWTLVAFMPGPAILCVMSQAERGGVRGSLPGIAGLQVGGFLFFVAVGTGLAALFLTMTTAFAILRLAGAAYLAWLGLNLILSTFRDKTLPAVESKPVIASRGKLFWQGLLIQLTNPKALLFCSALLPQFLDPHRPMFGQIALLFAITFVVDVAAMLTYATLAVRGAKTFRNSAGAFWLQRIFGAALIGFGGRLALSRK
jgi:homoserine/homoserine lactone efflux protein